jgi:NADPH2:quinone reductase
MRAVVLEHTGDPDALSVRDLPDPVAGDGQTVVEVRAAGINFLEVLVRQGRYPQAPPLPWVPGVEVAGEVDGRRVVALVRETGGGYAERVVVDDEWVFDLPDEASFEEGASFLMSFLTAWIPLTRQADVRPGMRVLVTAAAGATGGAAVQVARLLGAEVIGAVGSEGKLAQAHDSGATQSVTYEGVSSLDPVDVVFDLVGGELFASMLGSLRPLGVAVGVGFAGGWWQPVDPAQLVGRNIGLLGFYLGRLMKHRPEIVLQAADDLLRMWRQGLLHPTVGATFPLAEAGEAHRLIEERRSTGKVVLVP